MVNYYRNHKGCHQVMRNSVEGRKAWILSCVAVKLVWHKEPRSHTQERRMGCAGSNAAGAVALEEAVLEQGASSNQERHEDKKAAEAGSEHQRQRSAIAKAMQREGQKIH